MHWSFQTGLDWLFSPDSKWLISPDANSFAECADHTYFFATNIGADHDATGGNATEITMSILSDMNIWIQ